MSEWIIETITSFGYLGIFMLMLVESIFPPIPSELILPFAGFAVSRGDLDLWLVLLTTTAGALTGMLPWYIAARLFGLERLKWLADRFGRLFTVNSAEIDVATDWFRRFGPAIVFFGRMLPLIRTLISVPAGLAKMPFWQFALFSGLGAFLFNGVLVGAGYILAEHYDLVEGFIDPLTYIVLGGIVVTYLYRVVTWKPGKAP
jgi:membrane protein DedA with SNARE-associated domain